MYCWVYDCYMMRDTKDYWMVFFHTIIIKDPKVYYIQNAYINKKIA